MVLLIAEIEKLTLNACFKRKTSTGRQMSFPGTSTKLYCKPRISFSRMPLLSCMNGKVGEMSNGLLTDIAEVIELSKLSMYEGNRSLL